MFGWLSRLADEGHRSETVAARWHMGHVVAYVGLIGGYICMIAFHLSAASRHRTSAARQDSARPGR